MKKYWMAGIMVSLLCIILSACGLASGFDPQEDCLYISKDGAVQSALVEKADTDLAGAKEDELKSFIQSEIDAYTAQIGVEEAVSIAKAEIKDGTLKVIYNYKDPSYVVGWAEYSQDDSIAISSISLSDNTVTIEGPATIYFAGKIDKVSDGVKIDGNKVTTAQEGTSTITYK